MINEKDRLDIIAIYYKLKDFCESHGCYSNTDFKWCPFVRSGINSVPGGPKCMYQEIENILEEDFKHDLPELVLMYLKTRKPKEVEG